VYIFSLDPRVSGTKGTNDLCVVDDDEEEEEEEEEEEDEGCANWRRPDTEDCNFGACLEIPSR